METSFDPSAALDTNGLESKMFNKRFANALAGTPQAVPPIWLMRQAGRYHAHYQALKKTHTFMELCKDPDLAAEVAPSLPGNSMKTTWRN